MNINQKIISKITKPLLGLVILLIANISRAQQANLEWVKVLGSILSEQAKAIALDQYGNSYSIGEHKLIMDLDPGIGVVNDTVLVTGASNLFICKLNPQGNLIWAKAIGVVTTSSTQTQTDGNAIAVDTNGNVFITGSFGQTFGGTVDFDPGVGVHAIASNGGYDAFVLKLDSIGNFDWVKTFGGIGYEAGMGISIDKQGNIITTGHFQNVVDFDPGIGVTNDSCYGDYNIYVHKMDEHGNFIWAKTMGGNSDIGGIVGNGGSGPTCIALDSNNNIYTTGCYNDTVDFDPSIGIYYLYPMGITDIFISKLDSNGNFVWAKAMTGVGLKCGFSLKISNAGFVYSTGNFNSTVDFDPNGGIYNLSASSGLSSYIQKLDLDGNFIWAKQLSGYFSRGLGLALDSLSNVYTTGEFMGTVDFDPGLANYQIEATGVNPTTGAATLNPFISKLDSNGNFVWAKTFQGNTYGGSGLSIAIDKYNNVYSMGDYGKLYDFDPSNGIHNPQWVNLYDVYIHKMKQCNSSVTNSVTHVACDSLVSGGNVYTASGVYMQQYGSAQSCDSIVTLNLTINHATQYNFNDTFCHNYLFNNQIISTCGIFLDTLTNAVGCDSLIILNLVSDSNNTSISKSLATLTSLENGASYQWVTCPFYTIINGATSQAFTATSNGGYAVIVTKNGCTDTSNCVIVTLSNTNDVVQNDIIKIYPNPSNGIFNITNSEDFHNASLKVINLTGQIIYQKENISGSSFEIDISKQAYGVFFIEILQDGTMFRTKLIKE